MAGNRSRDYALGATLGTHTEPVLDLGTDQFHDVALADCQGATASPLVVPADHHQSASAKHKVS